MPDAASGAPEQPNHSHNHGTERDFIADRENTTGTAYYKDANDRSKLTVQLGTSPEANYWVVETDYATWSLVYSCTNLEGFARAEIYWILARGTNLPDDVTDKLKQVLQDKGLKFGKFTKTVQEKCPW
ncbi:hypothetical protein DPMN_176380 [Dreissena polymorpha]|uniref:Lipocalin/cytosolic fatty-acid binding domain-containing protein n=1 Tax=Dreissena polymorpha TaxID=45954 RepID=A0A9D4E9E4_DREPO|nr:hypothetical protein DPMN_176380 [Dreissena polymorpha]